MVETSLLAAPPFAAAPTRPGNAVVTLLPPRSIARIAAFKDSLAPLQNALGLTLPAPAKQTYHNAVYSTSGPVPAPGSQSQRPMTTQTSTPS